MVTTDPTETKNVIINHLPRFSLKGETRTIFVAVSFLEPNKAPPVMSTSLTHITFPGSFLMLLATFTVKEPLH